jgi:rod shape-determining protein MreC
VAVSRRTGRRRFPIVLLLLTAVTLLTLDVRGFAPLDSARSGVMAVLAPVGDFASNVFEPVGERWDAAFNSDQIQADNEELRRRVDELEGQMTNGQVAQESLRQVLAQLGIPFVADYQKVTGKVVSGGVGNFDTTIDIDKGSSAQIAKGMPAVTGRGLIGRVDQVSEGRTRIQLITDRTMKVGFNVVGTAVLGIAQGTGESGELTGVIDFKEQVAVGQTVVTSGTESSPYPADIPIGTITAIAPDEASGTKRLTIAMADDLSDLTFATVVLYPPPAAGPP